MEMALDTDTALLLLTKMHLEYLEKAFITIRVIISRATVISHVIGNSIYETIILSDGNSSNS